MRKMASGLCLHGFLLLLSRIRTTLEEISLSLLKILSVSIGPHMVAIITHDMTMRYFLFSHVPCIYVPHVSDIYHSKYISLFVKNVDAGAAKELMANLVSMQSSLSDVNK